MEDKYWDDNSRLRQNRLLVELAVCLVIVFLMVIIFG